ncbi:MAG TPA: hypothetical protein VFT22_22330 [Kofleriaceae bacterium]|nr:hypothetical protein [Kofleriaceae bacterium]
MVDIPDGYEAYYADKLWALLPAIYRAEDPTSTDGRGPLREIVNRIGAQGAVLRRSIDRLWEDQSIETCDDWVIAYLAELLATNLVASLDARGQRIDVAKTIYYRRRKGTVALLEELAADITGWNARVVEFFRRLGRARHGLDPAFGMPLELADPAGAPSIPVVEGLLGRATRTPLGGFADLRHRFGAGRAHTAFDELSHTADVRLGRGAAGWHNIPRLGVFLWRLYSVPLDGVTPVADAACPNQLTFDPTGRNVPLFAAAVRSYGDQWVSPAEHELPGPIDRGLLENALEQLYAAVDPDGALLQHALRIYEGATTLSNLVKVDRVTADPRAAATRYFIDPQAGRLYVPSGAPASRLLVGYHGGFSSAIGAGGYDRRVRGENPVLPSPVVTTTGGAAAFTGIGPGGTLLPSGTVTITDSLTYTSAPDFTIDGSAGPNTLVVRADNRRRPLIRLPVASPDPAVWRFTGTTGADQRGSTLVLDGVFVSGGELVLDGDFEQVTLSSTTLDPGDRTALAADGRALIPCRLRIKGRIKNLVIARSIVGPVVMEAGALVEALAISDTIVQAVDPTADALAIDTGTATISAATILGTARLHQVEVTTTIFHDVVTVADHQHGCVRFSAVPVGSVVPRPYECVTIRPGEQLFASRAFGQPSYAQLLASASPGVVRGAEDGSELGAFWRENNPIKERSLLIKYQEYMPIGLAPVLIYVT